MDICEVFLDIIIKIDIRYKKISSYLSYFWAEFSLVTTDE